MPSVRLPRVAGLRSGRVKWIASVLVGVMALTSLLAFAWRSEGYPANRVDLNDAGVWVTNDGGGLFGRLNKSASSLDAYFNPAGGAQTSYSLDLEQDQGTVLAWDKAGGKITPVDVASAKLVTDSSVPLPSTMVMDMRAGTVAVLEPTTGKIWATRYEVGSPTLPNLTAITGTSKPLAEITPQPKDGLKEGSRFSALAVAADGGVHAADITGKAVTIPVKESGSLGKPVKSTVPTRESIDLTAVGGHVVALDVVGGTITVDDQKPTKHQELVAGSRTQVPGPDAPEVVIAAPKALYGFSVSTPEARVRVISDAGAGTPAAPVYVKPLGAAPETKGCVYGAWSGSPGTVVKGCGGDAAKPLTVANAGAVLTRPVFRVNRSSVVVNDAADGQIYDLDSLQRVDNWEQVKDAATDQTVVDQQLVEQEKEKPKANRDDLGARPGRTTILHVLDNDTDKGGRVLSISSVSEPGNPNAKVSIAPDGQTLIYVLGTEGGDSDFTYQLSNGVAEEKGEVHVRDVGLTENNPPYLKAGAVDPSLTVASGGVLPIQVLDQWRDLEGDPVALSDAKVSAGTTNLTSDGRIELTAQATAEATQAQITYFVSDGRSDPIEHPLPVNVLGSQEIKSSPVVTQPDVGRGEVGRPIMLAPLMNDIPGADPLNPKAVMKLAAPVATKEGLQVATDLVSGQVSVTGAQPGHFFLEYAAAFGSAAVSQGALRVDIDPTKEDNRSPVAVPDKATVRGTGSVLVDVLSNDSDPLGSVLTVQGATASKPSELKVAVVNGRWLKVTPATAAFSENPTFLTYKISNGVTPPVQGTVSVTQLPTASPDQILTRQDYATVRTGDVTTIRVLENDAALSGATLSLLGNVPGAKAPGQLKVYNPGATDATGGNFGSAYVAGDVVRFVAPVGLKEQAKLMVDYVAQTEAGDRQRGLVEVTVTPEPTETSTNQAPTPHPVEVRAVSGETVTIPIDPTNADPDGDSTSVVGIVSAPTLGRVLGTSPTGIIYQAYPDVSAQGTDSFGYVVTDRFGATATSTIRVGVTPPALPQVAVPAPLSITAAPDAKVTLYPLSSASFGKTDPVKVLPLDRFGKDLPAGAAVDEKTQSIKAVAGSSKDRPVQFSYGLTGNAGESAPATVTVYAVDDFKNPPRLQDKTVKPDGSGKATIDVLETAYDPDGDSAKLKVTMVGHPQATISGGKITVPVTKNTRAIPYEVTDESGATSAAAIYVPSEGAGGPYLRTGKVIKVEEGKSVTVKVSDYVEDPQGKPVSLTFTDQIKAGPGGKVTASAPSGTELTVTGAAGYIGPGAIVAEFTNGKTLDDPEGIKTFVSIPVQVGPETPVIRCPTDVIPVIRGGRPVVRDVTSFCSVWSPTDEMAKALSFEGTWTTALDGVSITGGRSLTIDASSDATPGATGVISVTAAGTKAAPSTLNVIVQEAPLATMSPISLPEMKAGEQRVVDLSAYFASPLKDPKPHAISIAKTTGMDAQAAVEGMTATITPAANSHGRMEFSVMVSDVTEKNATDQARRVTGTIGFDVFTRPDAPGQPQLQATMMSRSVTLSWPTPASNGAPITGYEVSWGGGTQACAASPCVITGLTNGDDYTFTVKAQNKAGWSDPSPPVTTTQVNRPNAMPLAVNATQTAAGDGSATLTWPSAQGEGSLITDYVLAYSGITQRVGGALTATITGLQNGPPIPVTILAQNNSTSGPPTTTTVYAAGTPSITSMTITSPDTPQDAVVVVATFTGNLNGPAASTLVVNGTRAIPGNMACTATIDGGSYTFTGTCTNADGVNGTSYTYSAAPTSTFMGVSRTGAASSQAYTPKAKPSPPVITDIQPTGRDGEARITFNASSSRDGNVSTITASPGSMSMTAPAGGANGLVGTITGLANGTAYNIVLTASTSMGSAPSAPSQSVIPYGPLPAPTVTLTKTGPTTSRWTVTANGNGRPVTVQIRTASGQNNQDQTTTMQNTWAGDSSVGWAPASESVSVTVIDSAGRGNRTGSAGPVASDPKPNPTFTVSHGQWITCQDKNGNSFSCHEVFVSLAGWNASSSVRCTASPVGNVYAWDVTKVVGPDGNLGAFRNGLFDTTGANAYPEGTFAAGTDVSGLTCRYP